MNSFETMKNDCYNYFRLGYIIGRHEGATNDMATGEMMDTLYRTIDKTNPTMDKVRTICDKADIEGLALEDNIYFRTGYLVARGEARTGTVADEMCLKETYNIAKETERTMDELREACDYTDDHCEDDEDCCATHHCDDCERCDKEDDNFYYLSALPEIDHIIFSGKATIVFWTDGLKTVVRCQDGDAYSKEEGLAMAICKRAYGNDNTFNDVINEAMERSITTEGKSDAKTINSKKSK